MALLHKLSWWIPLAVVITGVCGMIYVSGQQMMRMGANDPQIQLAEDAAARLSNGETASAVVPTTPVEIDHSLAPYLIIFDQAGKPVAGNAQLDGKLPELPSGVFSSAQMLPQDRVTWQPRIGVRSALVLMQYKNNNGTNNMGFVAVGRSLREVENRANQLLMQVVAGWLALITVSLLAVLLFTSSPRKK